jgi:putative hydrolase of the HAD superfamily
MIEVVFFDAGETILHPHPSFTELFARVVGEHGRAIDPQQVWEVQERLAPHLADFSEEAGVEHGVFLSARDSGLFWRHLYRRFLGELGMPDEDLVEALYSTFSTSSSYRLFDDVLSTLDELSAAGYRLGLISNFERWLEEMLVELEVGHLFDVAVISELEGVEKPNPDIYRIALERAGVEAARTVHVGDSPTMDIRPARSVGITPILLDRGGRYPHEGELRVTTLKELPDVITNL